MTANENAGARRRRKSPKASIAAGLAALALLAGLSPLVAPTAAGAAETVVPEAEENDVATLPAASPHWAFLQDGWAVKGTRIIDGDTGRMRAMLASPALANIAIDPKGRYYYVAESIWTKGNRGTRQDLLTVYDAKTLALVSEITLPGRLLVGNRKQDLELSADGHYAYIYNMQPASSVIVVDLDKGKSIRTVETPGCGLVFPAPDGSFASLCSDGTLATITFDGKMQSNLVRSASFFSAENDPIFDNGALDHATGKATFLSYTGLIYPVTLGASPVIGTPWSIQEAAGIGPASPKPLVVSWLPGGHQPLAVNKATGHLYVLMHMGEYWSHKVGATEVWELDGATHKLIGRHRLPAPIDNIEVSQDDKPLLFLNTLDGRFWTLDATTYKELNTLKDVGTGNITVAGQ